MPQTFDHFDSIPKGYTGEAIVPIIMNDGSQDIHSFWTIKGVLHRDNDLPAVSSKTRKCWYKNGKLHREDGPAFIYTGMESVWYKHGVQHRLDGPAFAWGSVYKFLIEGIQYDKEEFWNHPKVIVFNALTKIQNIISYENS